MGYKYLGLEVDASTSYNLGWIKLYCSTNNDTLIISNAAYNSTVIQAITAGQASSANSNEILNPNITVYPNPANSEFKISGSKSGTKIYIYDLSGKLILSALDSADIIDVSGFKNGLYNLYIVNDNFFSYKKLIVRH